MADNERTARELAINLLLHEYDALRAEIVARTSSRFQLLGLAAVAATIVTSKWGTGKYQNVIVWGTIIGTILVAAAIWILFGLYINRCAGRLMQIEHELNNALGCDALIWESKRINFWQSWTRESAKNKWESKLTAARKCSEVLRAPSLADPEQGTYGA
jgi:hypothetical protein